MSIALAALAGAGVGALAAALILSWRGRARSRLARALPPAGHSIELVITDGRLVQFAAAGRHPTGRPWRIDATPPSP